MGSSGPQTSIGKIHAPSSHGEQGASRGNRQSEDAKARVQQTKKKGVEALLLFALPVHLESHPSDADRKPVKQQ